MTLQRTRKRRKPRLGGTACVGGKACIATHDYNGRRYCAFHLADVMFAHSVRASMNGLCRLQLHDDVKCNGMIQCAHVVSRRYRAVRWDTRNAMPLCMAHHVYYTHRPLEWEEMCRHIDIPWDDLRYDALNEPPMDADSVIATLKGVG